MKDTYIAAAVSISLTALVACAEPGQWDPEQALLLEEALSQIDRSTLAKAPAPANLRVLLGDPNPGSSVGVSTWHRPPGSPIAVLYGFDGEGAGPCPARFNGTCIDLLNPMFAGFVVTDADGYTYRDIAVPPAPIGTPMSVQAFDIRAMGAGIPVALTSPTTQNLSSPGCICTFIFWPVCGADGITYDNDCLAECEGAAPVRDGSC